MTIGCPIKPLLTRRPRIKMNQIHSNPPIKSIQGFYLILSHCFKGFKAPWHVISCFYTGWTDQVGWPKVTASTSLHCFQQLLLFRQEGLQSRNLQNVWVPDSSTTPTHVYVSDMFVWIRMLFEEQAVEHWRNVWGDLGKKNAIEEIVLWRLQMKKCMKIIRLLFMIFLPFLFCASCDPFGRSQGFAVAEVRQRKSSGDRWEARNSPYWQKGGWRTLKAASINVSKAQPWRNFHENMLLFIPFKFIQTLTCPSTYWIHCERRGL